LIDGPRADAFVVGLFALGPQVVIVALKNCGRVPRGRTQWMKDTQLNESRNCT
jgi:hypothetical protein